MTFGAVEEAYRQLRLRLQVQVGGGACAEITVAHPERANDELSFLRLVTWSYVLVQEAARVSLRFLKELPPFAPGELLPEVAYLRTWAAHNLLPEKDSDSKKLRLAWAWLREACGVDRPRTEAEWGACFARLCGVVGEVLGNAIRACEAFDRQEDGPRLVTELKMRVDKNWDAYHFDSFVTAAATRFGYAGLDAVQFRRRHLDSWRRVVASASEDAPERLIVRRIEADLLDLMNDALPAEAREFVARLKLEDTRELTAFLLAVRRRCATRDELGALLEQVARELSASIRNPAPELPGA